MRRALLWMAAAALPQFASAKTVQTELFDIDVPDEWQVEDNKLSIIFASGTALRDGMPIPSLSIQYCLIEENASARTPRCDQSCSAQALTRLLGRGIHVSPAGIQTRDTTDFHAEKSLGNDASAAALMVCGAKGSVYLALIAQERMAITVERLRAIRKSLRWRQPPAATRAP